MSKYGKVSFRGKVVSTFEKEKKARASFGYINTPKGVKMFSLPDGVTSFNLDFLPYLVTDPKHPDHVINPEAAQEGNIWWRRPYKIHRNVGSNNETIVCPTSFGKKCPICEYQTKRFKEGADKTELSALRAKSRSLYIVIPIGSDKFEETIFIWDMSNENFAVTLEEELKENEKNEDFFMFETGKTLDMRIKWETLGTNTYPVVRRINFLNRESYDEKILEDIPSLDDVFKTLTYDELRDKFFEMGDEPDGDRTHKHVAEDEEEKEPPKSFRRLPASKSEEEESPRPARRAKVEEEPEEDPAPRAKRPVRASVAEEEPEEAPPVRRSRPAPEKSVSSKDKCPYDHKFGIDTDKFDDCDTCEIWEDCTEAKEKR